MAVADRDYMQAENSARLAARPSSRPVTRRGAPLRPGLDRTWSPHPLVVIAGLLLLIGLPAAIGLARRYWT